MKCSEPALEIQVSINNNTSYLYKKKLPDNLNGNEPISGSGANLGPKWKGWKPWCLVLERGSRGPSTVTLIAFWYVATWGGDVASIMVSVNDFPVPKERNS